MHSQNFVLKLVGQKLCFWSWGDQEKSLSGKKFELPKKSNFFPLELFSSNFFWFIWKQGCYSNGRPLILKLVPNDEEWNDKEAWFNWIWQRKLVLKCNVTILKTIINVPNIQEWAVSCPIMYYHNLLIISSIDNLTNWIK